MATLLLRLAGPMQSWGTTSRFDQRDTGKEPSKSGVVGILAAALGIDRTNWQDLEPLAAFQMGVRHDRPGVPRRDYQTAQEIISADRSKTHPTAVTLRDYLADATFLVALAGGGQPLLDRIARALQDPVWPLYLGRRSYVPSDSIWIDGGIRETGLRETLASWPWIGRPRRGERRPDRLLLSYESEDRSGAMRIDQPIAAFSERRFGARCVASEWVSLVPEANDAVK